MPKGDWRRRHAIQIAAQLPENPSDAVAVLEFARELVDGFLTKPKPTPADHREGALLAFPADSGAKSRAS